MSRAEQYGLGMDYLIDLVGVLAPYGPVLVGGDITSHANDGPNAAAPRMEAAGYRYTKNSGVIYNFYAAPVKVPGTGGSARPPSTSITPRCSHAWP